MKILLSACLTALAAVAAFAQESKPLDPKIEKVVRATLPNCSDIKITTSAMPFRLPARFTGTLLRIESERGACSGQFAAVQSPTGGFYLGTPWYIGNSEGANPAEKLKNFAWRNLQQNVTITFDNKHTADGLVRTTLLSTTEHGKVPLEGEMDVDGTIFFLGRFRRMNGDMLAERAKVFEPFVATAPARGAANALVTVVEFSDFECPSCKYAAGYLDPILAKHGDKVRYVRYDLPLSGHPWAFPAAMAGRAIYRQKPEAFWAYKKHVYANQDKLSAFTFDDFARGFAQDQELDLKRYDADVASEAIRTEILKGVGTAFTNDIRATPSYLVNGVLVDAGTDGKALAEYVEKLLAQ